MLDGTIARLIPRLQGLSKQSQFLLGMHTQKSLLGKRPSEKISYMNLEYYSGNFKYFSSIREVG